MQRAPDPSLQQQLATISTQLTTHVKQYDSDQLRLMTRDHHQQRLQDIRGTRDLFQVCAAAASEVRDHNIATIANGLAAGAMIYEGYVALTAVTATTVAATAVTTTAATASAFSTVMAAAGPWALLGAGALTLFQSFRRKKRGDDGAAMRAIFAAFHALSHQIANMHQELREFRQENYQLQLMLLKTLYDGFTRLESIVHSEFVDFMLPISNKLDWLEASQQQWGQLHNAGIQDILLDKYVNLVKRIVGRLNESETTDPENKVEKLLAVSADWLELNGKASRPSCNGAQGLVDRPRGLDVNKWVNEVAFPKIEKNIVANKRGFLASYAKHVLAIDTTGAETLFNPMLWIPLADLYLLLRFDARELKHDRKHTNLDKIIAAAEANLVQIRTAQKDVRPFTILFHRHEQAVQGLTQLVDEMIAAQNRLVNKQMNQLDPNSQVNIDITSTAELIIHQMKDELPMHEGIVATKPYTYAYLTGHAAGIGIKFSLWHLGSGKSDNTKYKDCVIHRDFIAEFVLLERLSLGKFKMEYWCDYKKPSGFVSGGIIYNTRTNVSYTQFMEKEISIEFSFEGDKFQPIVTLKQDIDTTAKKTDQKEIYPPNIVALREQARRILNEFLLKQRKAALQTIMTKGEPNVAWQSLSHALDASKRIILANATDLGVQEAELTSLTSILDSNLVCSLIDSYIQQATAATPLPSTSMLQSHHPIKQVLLDKFTGPVTYFQNPIEQKLASQLDELRLLKQYEQAYHLNNEREVLQDKITTLKEIFEHYEININIWAAEKYHKQISAIDRSGRMYQSLMKNISLVMPLVDNLSTEIESLSANKLLTMVRDLLRLNTLCSQINAALRHLSPADIYRFGPNDFGFLVTDQETLKQLEKELSKLQEVPTTSGRFRMFTSTTGAELEERGLSASQPSSSPAP